MEDGEMCVTRRTDLLSEYSRIPYEVCRIINNSYYEHHPFKQRSGSQSDFIKILPIIRSLPSDQFHLCLESIKTRLDQTEYCNCFVRGMAYLKYLTKGIDEEECQRAIERYNLFMKEMEQTYDYDRALVEVMLEHGIDPSAF